MRTTTLNIPPKIKVGFQKRNGTYTGKLAYVIYYDEKGKLRKESSWEGWRHKDIPPVEFDNEPTEGFVLNKGVGGQRESYGWNARNEYIRVYDPRDFEFEISVSNLLFILRECDCNKGKGLEGKFVYAWDGTALCLIPVGCEDYKASRVHNDLKTKSVKAKELVPGITYLTKKQDTLVYLGKFDWHYLTYKVDPTDTTAKADPGVMKRHVFWQSSQAVNAGEDEDLLEKNEQGFIFMDSVSTLAQVHSDVQVDNFADLVTQYRKSAHGSPASKLFLKSSDQGSYWYYEESPGVMIECGNSNTEGSTSVSGRYSVENGCLVKQSLNCVMHRDANAQKRYDERHRGYYWYDSRHRNTATVMPWVEPTKERLWVVLESGRKIKNEYHTFSKG